eukprot:gnl/Chilomastix_cuspidata/2325.p1 GENE.gnl/Chilomastix_cuspidata/2325~~gnl/Chilomastix_cuspidata/2325.p1  ORF type:complete len:345 (+),score=71.07 gnl/Chilomastix_cuspidata/2325:32-1036(+)
MRLHILGAAAGRPCPLQSTSAYLLELNPNGPAFLFDCGEETFRTLLTYEHDPNNILAIFISHAHMDHISGLYGFLRNIEQFSSGRSEALFIVGPPVLHEFYELSRAKDGWGGPSYPLLWLKLHRPARLTSAMVADASPVFSEVLARANIDVIHAEHRIAPAFGYVVDVPAPLCIPHDAQFGALTVRPAKFVYTGDTCAPTTPASARCDCLLREATHVSRLSKVCAHYGHSTVADTLADARAAHARTVVLTHFSNCYTKFEPQRRAERFDLAAAATPPGLAPLVRDVAAEHTRNGGDAPAVLYAIEGGYLDFYAAPGVDEGYTRRPYELPAWGAP